MKRIIIVGLLLWQFTGTTPAQTNDLAVCNTLVASGAPLTLGRAFGDHMVLQRNAPGKIFGTTTPGASVIVTFGVAKIAVNADANGRWLATLPAMAANTNSQTLSVTDGRETKAISDVLVGDVWLCSGQSNMKFKVKQSVGGREEIASASDPHLRLLNMIGGKATAGTDFDAKAIANLQPEQFYTGSWQECSPNTVPEFSSVAYLVGKKLRETQNVPVGLICNAVGGSPAAAWLPEEVIRSRPEYAGFLGADWMQSPRVSPWVKTRAQQDIGTNSLANHPYKPAFLFESGVRCLAPMTLTGCLWYQGESDAELTDSAFNEMVLTDLINGWRRVLGQKNLPFFMVQLPRIKDARSIRAHWPEFREVQANVAAKMTNVFNCVTIDLGTADTNVHPPDKRPVAARLANLIRQKIYGDKIAAESPALDRFAVNGGTLTVWFRDSAGLTAGNAAPREFQIAGSDGNYVPATAVIRADGGVDLTAPEVVAPVAARYCWAVFVQPNLVNAADLPVAPFRTDKTDEVAKAK